EVNKLRIVDNFFQAVAQPGILGAKNMHGAKQVRRLAEPFPRYLPQQSIIQLVSNGALSLAPALLIIRIPALPHPGNGNGQTDEEHIRSFYKHTMSFTLAYICFFYYHCKNNPNESLPTLSIPIFNSILFL